MPPVVILSPFFPPSSSVLGRRNARLARFLPEFGWQPIVVSLPDGGGRGQDPDSLTSIPPEVHLDWGYAYGWLGRLWGRWDMFKARRRALSNDLPSRDAGRRMFSWYERWIGTPTATWGLVDSLMPYVWGAARRATRLARENGARAIYAASCPRSNLVAGVLAGAWTGLPVILDMRDPWTLNQLYFGRWPAWRKRLERRLERWCLARASHVFLNTAEALRAHREVYPELADKLELLHNGYDSAVARNGEAPQFPGFSLVHFGNCYAARPLTPVLKALVDHPEVHLICYGDVPRADRQAASALGLDGRLEVRPPVSYLDTQRVLKGASALLLLQPPETQLQIPAKFFDYLASDRPILSLSANPEIDAMLERRGRGVSADIRDPDQVQAAIRALLSGQWRDRPLDREYVASFDAPAQCASVARALDLTSRSAPGRPDRG